MANKKILEINKLGTRWEASDPFLFCVHHNDQYPEGNDELGPNASLEGRNIGSDFSGKDGWSMYHGDTVPGFPEHPHRGFETVTAVLEGFVDHHDSTGAKGRFGPGDVQWMTAGRGARHSEMFPLVNQDSENPTELFQIWLNLPRKDKFVVPHYKMLWKEDIPDVKIDNANRNTSTVRLISGRFDGKTGLSPSPNSWASFPDNHVTIAIIKMDPDAELTLPKVSDTLNRTLYHYSGNSIQIEDTKVTVDHSVKLTGNEPVTIKNGNEESHLLLLEGEPIGEPVFNHGPFVMTTEQEIRDAYNEYRNTGFGDWQWGRPDPVHPRNQGRFAKYPDGTVEVFKDFNQNKNDS